MSFHLKNILKMEVYVFKLHYISIGFFFFKFIYSFILNHKNAIVRRAVDNAIPTVV